MYQLPEREVERYWEHGIARVPLKSLPSEEKIDLEPLIKIEQPQIAWITAGYDSFGQAIMIIAANFFRGDRGTHRAKDITQANRLEVTLKKVPFDELRHTKRYYISPCP